MSAIEARTTDRLILEPIGPQHVDDIWRLYRDPVVATWYGGAWSRQDAEAFCAQCAYAWTHDGVHKWIAHDRSNGALVGRGGLSRISPQFTQMRAIADLLADPAWAKDRLEIGWALLSAFRGRGLATEIGREGLRFADEVLGTDRVVSFTERHNLASRRVMERLGLGFRGEIRSVGLIEGDRNVHDDAPFAVYATLTRVRSSG